MAEMQFTEDEQEASWLRAVGHFRTAVENGEADRPTTEDGIALQGPYSRIPSATAEAVTGFVIGYVERTTSITAEMPPEDRRAAWIGGLLRVFLLGRILGREVDAELAVREVRS